MLKLQIIPFGTIPEDLLNSIKEELKNTYNIQSTISEKVEPPKEAYNPLRHQFQAGKILEFLSQYKTRVLGITDKDIYTEDLNFVFGQAQLGGNIALVSIERLNPMLYKKFPDKKLLIDRTIKEVIHETGHTLKLAHCQNSRCVMSFSNTIFDVDKKTKNLCDMCKLQLGI
jgi:archaemetzincin